MDDLQRLITLAQSGDAEAWQQLVARFSPELYALVERRLGARLRRKLDASDVVQSALADVLRDLPHHGYRGPRSFFRWLCRVVEHKLAHKKAYFAALRRDVARETPIERERASASSLPVPDSAEGPLELAERDERKALVQAEIERLQEPLRSVMQLHPQLTDGEIGRQIGKTAEQVRRLRIEAMQALARRLRKRLASD